MAKYNNNNNTSSSNDSDDFLEHLLGHLPHTHAHNHNQTPPTFGGGGLGFPLPFTLEQQQQGKTTQHLIHSQYSHSRPPYSANPGFQFQGTNIVPAPPQVQVQPPGIRPRVRARRGQATDPHSIAERLRRERIAERIRALQDLVPSVNKTDRAAMLDEVVDYVKFLRLQVKVLSMSRLGGAGAVAPLVTDMPISSIEEESSDSGRGEPPWEKWSNDGTERQVAKFMEENNVGGAMQFLQSKALCIMPISLASAIYNTQQPPDTSSLVDPESNPPPS